MSLTRAYHRLAGACPALALAVGAPGPGEAPGPGDVPDVPALGGGPADGPGARPGGGPGGGPGSGLGWVSGAELAYDETVLRAWLEAETARIAGTRGKPVRPDVAASRALHGYLWSACLLVSGPWYLERRVPRLRPEHVWIGPGSALRVAVPDAFACLPGDPAASEPGAVVRDGEEVLRAELRRVVADHAAPLLAALRTRTRRGERALWGMVGDDLISGLWRLGAALGDEERGAAMATLVLPAAQPPFPGGADFRRLPVAEPGADRLTRTRTGCCLYYTIEPRDVCGTCPRLTAPGASQPAAGVACHPGGRWSPEPSATKVSLT